MYDLDNPRNPRGTPDYLVSNSGGGAPEWLAVIDFENDAYSVGASSKAIDDMLVGGELGDVSSVDGWFPQITQYPNFGSDLDPVFARAGGFVVVVDAHVSVAGSNGSLLIVVTNADNSNSIQISIKLDEITLFPSVQQPLVSAIEGSDVRRKYAARIAATEFATDFTGGSEATWVPAEGEFDTWAAAPNSYMLAGGTPGLKVYSIKFSADDADLAALVAA